MNDLFENYKFEIQEELDNANIKMKEFSGLSNSILRYLSWLIYQLDEKDGVLQEIYGHLNTVSNKYD